jgi:uncharacterized protein YybS (DUF2232 family)
MPLTQRGPKTLQITTGVFLIMGILVVAATAQALPFALFVPALYAVFSDRVHPYFKFFLAAAIPFTFIVAPGFIEGVVLYASLIACGLLIRRFLNTRDAGMAVFAPSCLIFFLFVLSVWIMAIQEGVSFQAVVSRWVGEVMKQVALVYNQILSSGDLAEFRVSRAAMETRIAQLFWGIIASSVMSVMWLNVLVAAQVMKTVKLRHWKGPDWMVGLFIAAGFFILVNHDAIRILGLNLMIVVSQIYFFQGLAIVAAFLTGYNWSKVVRWVIYILILSQIYIMIAVTALGLFDTWFNFRNRIRSSEGDR